MKYLTVEGKKSLENLSKNLKGLFWEKETPVSLNIVGFGGFQVVKRKGRKGINPRTGKGIKIPDVKIAKFRTGKRLKEAVK